mgnify:CR=1 FL=1
MKQSQNIDLGKLMGLAYEMVLKDMETPGHYSNLTLETLKVIIDYERKKQN